MRTFAFTLLAVAAVCAVVATVPPLRKGIVEVFVSEKDRASIADLAASMPKPPADEPIKPISSLFTPSPQTTVAAQVAEKPGLGKSREAPLVYRITQLARGIAHPLSEGQEATPVAVVPSLPIQPVPVIAPPARTVQAPVRAVRPLEPIRPRGEPIALPPPFEQTAWGTSEQVLRSMFEIAWHSWDFTQGSDTGDRILAYYITADRLQMAKFHLMGDSLYRIEVYLKPSRSERLEDLQEQWRQWLAGRYAGAEIAEQTKWSDGRTTVRIGRDAQKGYVWVDFTYPAARLPGGATSAQGG